MGKNMLMMMMNTFVLRLRLSVQALIKCMIS